MADAADLADEAAAAHLERSLAARRAAALRDEADPGLAPGAPRDCVDCGAAVPRERLAAMPLATRCVTCQRMAEDAGWL